MAVSAVSSGVGSSGTSRNELILVSASSREQLSRAVHRLRDQLSRDLRVGAGPALADVAYTTQTARVAMTHRLAVWSASVSDLVGQLDQFLAGQEGTGISYGALSADDPPEPQASQPGDLAEAAATWLRGSGVDWEQYWEQPASRLRLPTYPFAETGVLTAPLPPVSSQPASTGSVRDLEHYLCGIFAEVSQIPAPDVHPRVPLEHYGLNSLMVDQLNARIERDLGETSRTIFFSHPDLAGVAAEIAGHAVAPAPDHAAPDHAAPDHAAPDHAAPDHAAPDHAASGPAERADERAIAIIGLAGRYPMAATVDEFWASLLAGRDCVTELPPKRARAGWPTAEMWGGFLDDVDMFDPLLFQITPRDANLMDPQERLFLEVTWEALDDAGYCRTRLREQHRSEVAVFAGSMYNDYPFFGVEQSLAGEPAYSGSAIGGIANRVSYFFDLHGPSLTVDTMCSSSLTAIHLAIASLRHGESQLAVAGAVNLSIHPNKFIQQKRMKLTATDRRSRSFGAGGDGFVPSEGVGVVILKPLQAALADGDRVRAVIRGSAVVHSGRTNGFIVPSPAAQADLVGRAMKDAAVDPAGIGYIEAHGAGTALGDPVEIDGLTRAFARASLPPGAIRIGAVKSNIGHVEAAAGVAALTKVVLQLEHRMLVPSLHADELNPNVDWDKVPFAVQREVSDWPAPPGPSGQSAPRRAGVSSFGAGGTITHLVVEEAGRAVPRQRPDRPHLLVLSGYDEPSLRDVARRLASTLRRPGCELDLGDVAWTLQIGREHLRQRLAIIATGLADAVGQLDGFLAGDTAGLILARAAVAAHPAVEAPWPPGAEPTLSQVARHWVTGGAVTWAGLHAAGGQAGDPPALVSLPSYPFARVRCWLPDPVRPLTPKPDADDQGPEVPLTTKVWEPAIGTHQQQGQSPSVVVCLADELSAPVVQALARDPGETRYILVRQDPGSTDGKATFDGGQDPVALVGQLNEAEPAIAGWIDLCDLSAVAEPAAGWRSRLAMLQQIVALKSRFGLRILHVQGGLADLAGAPASLAGARIAAFVKSLGAEYQRISATTLEVGDADAAETARYLRAELGVPAGLTEICYRKGVRYEPRLAPVLAPHVPLRPDSDRTYLVSGGTRGLGARVARFLVERGATRLAILGRQPLPPVRPGPAGSIRALEDAGARVLVYTGPLTDRAALTDFLDRVRVTSGPIGGVVHCAGAFSQGRPAFVHKTMSDFDAVLEPKAEGLMTLEELCRADAPDFFVVFSSICAAVPALAAGVVDYAAANAVADYYVGYRRRQGPTPLRSVNWPMWTSAGSGAGQPNPCTSVGVAALDDADALRVLERVIALPAGMVTLPCPPTGAPVDLAGLLRVPAAPASLTAPPTAPAGPGWLTEIFAGTLGLPADALDPTADFGDLGVESVMLGELLELIERKVGRRLEPALLLDHSTLDSLAARLASAGLAPNELAPIELAPAEPQVTTPPPAIPHRLPKVQSADSPIAVVGIACRFPGAPDLATFWANLAAGRCSVTEVPRSRWDPDRYYRADLQPGMSTSRWGGFVDGIEYFDAGHFGLTPEQATGLDPAIRLFLETAAMAIADAGYAATDLWGAEIGVFAGGRGTDYARRAEPGRQDVLQSDQNFIAAHVAHHFNLRGPSLVIDSACSSSLVSTKLAIGSLAAGDCSAAIVGGIEVLLDERPYLEFSAARAISGSPRCYAFDERADGFVPGEGCGVVLLKPLAAALADGDRIQAVIESVAVNNDGHTMGVTTPSATAQAAVVRRALARSGRQADEIPMIEAHGTGTMIGDPIELRALTDVFRETTSAVRSCAVGSVKSNVGHLLSAAGMAGLIKVVLSLQAGQIPATLFCETPNPRFDFAASPFYPNVTLTDWPAGRPRVAGLSSFGLGGTNAHAIIAAHDPVRHGARTGAGKPPLPPPVLRRQRLWLDRPAADRPAAAPASSLLQLEFR